MQFWGTFRGFAQQGPITSQLKQTFYYPRGLKRYDEDPVTANNKPIINYDVPVGKTLYKS
jgi:hypothetical protein